MESQNLRIRRVAIDTWRESVVYLHRDCAVVRATGFQALSKVMVRANGMTINAVLNVVDDEAIVKLDELGLSEDAFVRLNVEAGHAAQVLPAEPPISLSALHRKIAGERLSREDCTPSSATLRRRAIRRSNWLHSSSRRTAMTSSAMRCCTSPKR